MKKKLIPLLFLAVGFLFLLPLHAFAATNTVVDDAGLFTAEEIQSLTEQTADINKKFKGELFIYTTTTTDEDTKEAARTYLRGQIGNNENGAVLLIDMGTRSYYLATSGNMIDYLTDSRIKAINEEVEEGLRSSDYYSAATAFLDGSSRYIDEGVPGGHYYIDETTGKITRYKVLTPLEILIALGIAAAMAIAFFVSVTARYQLKRAQYRYPFREKSSLTLSRKEDTLTNSFVRTRVIPRVKNNNNGGGGSGGSTIGSSGGGTFGGGGGKF